MKVSMNWISDYVDLSGLNLNELIHRFTLSTAEVEEIYELGTEVQGIVVGEIVKIEAHPNSQKLHLVTVRLGDTEQRVVCGAPNVRVGMRIPFAPLGSSVVGMTIGEASIAGVLSCGMCCSAKELGLADSSTGLMELPEDAPLGALVTELYDIRDTVFEVDNKSLTNRPDLWGHYGIAREFSAIAKRPLKPLELADLKQYDNLPEVPVGKIDSELCYRYTALRIDHIKKNVSPINMQIRLFYCGMRAISLLADLTNYIMLELGQPTHAFDSRKIETIQVERIPQTFEFETLDGTKRKIDPETLMIKSNETPVAIAGVMGGLDSEIVSDTDSVTLECATFSAVSVRKTSTRIGLRTDASMRYEKTLDPELCEAAAARFTKLLLAIEPEATVVSRFTDRYGYHYDTVVLDFDQAFIDRYTGIRISAEQIVDTLCRLGFDVKQSDDQFTVTVPSWRATKDVTIKADVVEEITRIYGYDNFVIETTMSALHPVRPLQVKADERAIKDALVKQFGLHEVHTYIWCDAKKLAGINIALPENVSLLNGMNPDTTVLRNSIQLTLLPVLNENRFYAPDFGVFEIGRIVAGQKENGDCNERRTLGVTILSHTNVQRTRFAEVLDMISSIIWNLRRQKVSFERINPTFAWQHPANTAGIFVNGKELGYVSVVHPEVQEAIDKRAFLITAEMDLDTFAEIAEKDISYDEPSKFPGIDIDLSFIVNKEGTFGEIAEAFEEKPYADLKKITLVDVYEADIKSITIRLHFVSPVKTLSKPEVQEYIDEILSNLARKNIVLRG